TGICDLCLHSGLTNRDRWRVYKKVSVMFFPGRGALTVVPERDHQYGAPFELQRQARWITSEEWSLELHWKRKTGMNLGKKPFGKLVNTSHSLKLIPRTWDVTSSNCSAKPQLTSQDWFQSLEDNFKQFMLYRHCRILPNLSPPKSCTGEINFSWSFRKTWGKEQVVDGKRIKTLFLLGKPSNQAERANHQELVEWDFLDSFFNLTLKKRLTSSRDDDVFVSVENIFEFLDSSNHEKNLFKKKTNTNIPQALCFRSHLKLNRETCSFKSMIVVHKLDLVCAQKVEIL
uniref:UDP-GlcNAc:betaGal beta-1,3-N-acetylglucosaminyltransferase 7 n=1 Tax=Seriola dumerili TaxID=41447 RepID=A0A3B4TR97_SERDU